MFEFGKEQPIANNESLYEKKDGVYELRSDRSQGRNLNRYSFVNKGANSDSVPPLVRALLNQTGSRVVILVSWLVDIPSKSSVAAKVIEKKYLKKGWDVFLKNNHYLATKEVDLNEIDSWPPLEINTLDGGFLLLAGNEPTQSMLNVVNEECSLFLARARYFAPNSEFFKQLESNSVSVLYQVNDDQNKIGIVLIGKPVINMALAKNINIIEIHEGDSAYKAFV